MSFAKWELAETKCRVRAKVSVCKTLILPVECGDECPLAEPAHLRHFSYVDNVALLLDTWTLKARSSNFSLWRFSAHEPCLVRTNILQHAWKQRQPTKISHCQKIALRLSLAMLGEFQLHSLAAMFSPIMFHSQPA